MKKYIIGIILSLFIGINTVNAYEVKTGDSINLSDEITSSSFVFGNVIDDESKINGLGVVFGNSLNISSLSDYSINFGNSIIYKGTTKDLIIFGNTVVIEKEAVIERDLIVFASNVVVKGQIGGSLRILSKSATISTGTTLESVQTTCDNLTIDGNTTINNLMYNGGSRIGLKDGLIVNKALVEEEAKENDETNIFSTIFLSLISNYLIFAVLLFTMPRLLVREKHNYSRVVAYGLGYTFIIPLVSILLLLSVYGSKLSVILIIMYIVSILTCTAFSGYILGKYIWDKLIKKDGTNYLKGLLGITILVVLSQIPYLNILIAISSFVIASGSLIELTLDSKIKIK